MCGVWVGLGLLLWLSVALISIGKAWVALIIIAGVVIIGGLILAAVRT